MKEEKYDLGLPPSPERSINEYQRAIIKSKPNSLLNNSLGVSANLSKTEEPFKTGLELIRGDIEQVIRAIAEVKGITQSGVLNIR